MSEASDKRESRRANAKETAHYKKERATRSARRARLERQQSQTGEIQDDEWVIEDRSQLKRVPRGPEPLADVLATLVGDRRWDERLRGVDLFTVWADVVGPDLAQHIEPVRLAGGILVVRTSSPAWATQITYLADDLVARCNEALGEPLVTRIDVKVS